ncbi:DUF6270 domain-containing protein [Luteimonas sp. A482]
MPACPRIFILGSCVSRDAFALTGHGLELAGYIARTSLASAFLTRPAPPSVRANVPRIASRFQRRMVDIDLRKRALSVIEGAQFDFLLVDLIDERFNLARFGGSNTVPELFTLSRELASVSGWTGPVVTPGTNQHLAVWKRGVGRLLRTVPPARIIVNRAFWAREFDNGEPLENQALIAQRNRTLETMYGYLQRNGVGAVIDYPDGIFADPGHRWGVAPFHYATRMYELMIAQLQVICAAPGHMPMAGLDADREILRVEDGGGQ